MQVGNPEEGNIVAMVPLAGRLLVVKGTAVYEIKMADRVDPQRINPGIPNIQQKVLSIGAESPFLERTLLTAHTLLKPMYLPNIDCDEAMRRAFAAAEDTATMSDNLSQLLKQEEEALEKLEGTKLVHGFMMPTTDGLAGLCKAFIQRADHFVNAALDIARLFYPEVTHADSLLKVGKERHLEQRTLEFYEHLRSPFCFVRNARNAVEHPDNSKRIEVTDFALRPDGLVEAPTIELKHPDTPEPAVPVVVFMRDVAEQLTLMFELLLVHLCYHEATFADFRLAVMKLPEERRRLPHVQYSYASLMGDRWMPFA